MFQAKLFVLSLTCTCSLVIASHSCFCSVVPISNDLQYVFILFYFQPHILVHTYKRNQSSIVHVHGGCVRWTLFFHGYNVCRLYTYN